MIFWSFFGTFFSLEPRFPPFSLYFILPICFILKKGKKKKKERKKERVRAKKVHILILCFILDKRKKRMTDLTIFILDVLDLAWLTVYSMRY